MKSQFSFTENELKIAATIVSDALLDAMPSPSEVHYDLSEDFSKKMNVLCARARRQAKIRTVLQRAAMFFLATLIALGTWLTVDSEARASFLDWVKEIYENSTLYHFLRDADITELPNYTMSWLPEGFTILLTDTSSVGHTEYYENSETGESIFFVYNLYNTGFAPEVFYDYSDGSKQKTISINGTAADYYPGDESSATSVLIWSDEINEVWFSLSSDLDESTIIRIAENVKLSKSTK